MVFCENRNVDAIKNAFVQQLGYASADIYSEYVGELIQLYTNNETREIKNETTRPKPTELNKKTQFLKM